jgi:hypothetical protein
MFCSDCSFNGHFTGSLRTPFRAEKSATPLAGNAGFVLAGNRLNKTGWDSAFWA